MLDPILAKIFGTKNERETKRMRPIVAAINDLEPAMQQLSDTELAQLESLIEVPDPDLYAALTGDRALPAEHASALFDRIKAFRVVDHDA